MPKILKIGWWLQIEQNATSVPIAKYENTTVYTWVNSWFELPVKFKMKKFLCSESNIFVNFLLNCIYRSITKSIIVGIVPKPKNENRIKKNCEWYSALKVI